MTTKRNLTLIFIIQSRILGIRIELTKSDLKKGVKPSMLVT